MVEKPVLLPGHLLGQLSENIEETIVRSTQKCQMGCFLVLKQMFDCFLFIIMFIFCIILCSWFFK